MYVKKFCRRIADDFKHKELLPLKMLFFVHSSTVLVLYPYLTIHMRELGINVEETAIMSAVTPVVAIVMPPVAGIIADRIGNFKLMLALFSSLGGLAALLLLAVPVGRYNVKYPDRVHLSVGCPGSSLDANLEAVWADQHPCRAAPWTGTAVNLTLENCGVVCRADLPDRGLLNRTLQATTRFSLRISDSSSHSDTFSYGLSPAARVGARTGGGALEARLLPGVPGPGPGPGSTESSGSTLAAYFPTPGLHTLACDNSSATTSALRCKLGRDAPAGDGSPLDRPTPRTRLVASLLEVADDVPQARRFKVTGLGFGSVRTPQLQPAACSDAFLQDGRSAAVWLSSTEPHSPATSLSRCSASCLVSAPRALFCSNAQDLVEVDPSFTFWMYLCVRVFVGVISGTSFAMFEGAVIAILREHNADYGLQRIYASIGGMISSPLSGILIDYASSGKHTTDFRPAFYLYAALKLASGLLMLRINLEFKAPAQNIITDVLQVLRNVEMVCLFIVCFLLGTAWGYIENFLFWLLQDLGASRSLMGVTVTVGGVAGIPLLVLSGPIIARFGHANVLFLGFIFYAVRLFGYSMIYNPWLCLVFEAMESFTTSLATTAAVTYAATLSTSSTDTSVQGLIGGLYYGVGKGAGSLIGGFLMKAVGTRNTYRVFAAGSLAAGVVYFAFNHLYLRHKQSARLKEKDLKASSDKDQEACVMSEITKDKSLGDSLGEQGNKQVDAVIINNKAVDSSKVQQKNSRNSALQAAQAAPAAPGVERAPLAPLARTGAARDYSATARRYSAHSLALPGGHGEDTVRRRKSTDCGLSGSADQAKET